MKRIVLPLMLLSSSLFAQNKPFPQGINYPGCIKPAITQTTLNSDVSSYYTYWKGKYLKNDLTSVPGGYYVLGDVTGSADGASGKSYKPLGSSEGQGYGMVITVLMAGFDANAHTIYDGLFKTARALKSTENPNLMGWLIAQGIPAAGDFDSATDGDMDIAYSLILAHYQWGSTGTINYLAEAKKMITSGLKAANVTTGNRLNLGDWDSKSATNTRPSDWMMSHMRAFASETGDVTWTNVITNLYNTYNTFSTKYSPNTGLVTDFIVKNPAEPCPANFLDEYPETNTYSYNACRFPLRIAMDYGLYGSPDALAASNKLVNWIKTKTNSTPTSIVNGYNLDGSNSSAGGSTGETVFMAPFVAASVVNSANQAFLNSGWTAIKAKKVDYFSDSYNMLCLLFISGNWWIPAPVTTDLQESFTEQTTVTLLPNPANDHFSISAGNAEITSVSIVNLLGQEVYSSSNIVANPTIDISTFPTDVYVVKVLTGSQTFTARLIKQ